MTTNEKLELIHEIERQALKKIDKEDPTTAFREGMNYGIMVMFNIAIEIIEGSKDEKC